MMPVKKVFWRPLLAALTHFGFIDATVVDGLLKLGSTPRLRSDHPTCNASFGPFLTSFLWGTARLNRTLGSVHGILA